MATIRSWAIQGLAALALVLAAGGCLKSAATSDNHPQCTRHSDCGSGFACAQGACMKVGCARNEDCSAGQVCIRGSCVSQAPTCANNAECAAPTVCSEHRCIELAATDCEVLETSLDLGVVAVGVVSARRSVEIRNHSTRPFTITIGDIGSDVGPVFELGAGFAAGDSVVPAADAAGIPGALFVPLVFRPLAPGDYFGTLPVGRPCAGEVALHGVGVEHTLECAPALDAAGSWACGFDFGYVNPGSRTVREVTFTNRGDQPVQLTFPGQGTLAPFAIESVERVFSVPASGGSISIPLSFAPTQLGGQHATVPFTSDDANRPSGVLELSGVGGGPVIRVTPEALDFGPVVVDTYQYRRLTVANVGTDVAGTSEDDLAFPRPPAITGTDAAEFSVEWQRPNGLQEGQNSDLRVKFAPRGAGPKSAALVIESNDPAHPRTLIQLSGSGLLVPPCDFVVTPATVDFGLVEAGRSLTLNFSIVNRATDPDDICQVTLLDMSAETRAAGAFVLLDGALGINSVITIPGGAAFSVPVRFLSQPLGTYAGEVRFLISSPATPEVSVTLAATVNSSCWMIAPREFDFGVVGLNCDSRERTFNIYNTCGPPMTITSLDLSPGASTEFRVTRRPALPLTVGGGRSAEIGVTYRPRNVGDDAAAVAITLPGTGGTLMVPLQGRGATDPVQTETFAPTTKVDVLFIVDDSSSMTNVQAALSRNFSSFIRSADLNHIDYHIATTTVSLDNSAYACGRFVPLTGSAYPRIITPSTPGRSAAFDGQMMQGTSGSGTESLIRPAYLALTPPNSTGHNAGFYRDDARLAIVVLSDAADQDLLAMPVSFYEDFFWNLKGWRRRSDFSFSGWIPLSTTAPAGCGYDSSDAPTDPRVQGLIRDSGGVAEEVCSSGWALSAARVGERVFGARSMLFLASVPDMTVAPNPIQITVDGLPFAELNPRGGRQWTYDPSLNAVRIEPSALLAAEATVSVSYHVACP